MATQSFQAINDQAGAPIATYWMWRFDRVDALVPQNNFWGKTTDSATNDLRAANNPFIGIPNGPVEVITDPYYPRTQSSLEVELRNLSVHFGGRNRLFLDWHVEYLRDLRTR